MGITRNLGMAIQDRFQLAAKVKPLNDAFRIIIEGGDDDGKTLVTEDENKVVKVETR